MTITHFDHLILHHGNRCLCPSAERCVPGGYREQPVLTSTGCFI